MLYNQTLAGCVSCVGLILFCSARVAGRGEMPVVTVCQTGERFVAGPNYCFASCQTTQKAHLPPLPLPPPPQGAILISPALQRTPQWKVIWTFFSEVGGRKVGVGVEDAHTWYTPLPKAPLPYLLLTPPPLDPLLPPPP